ncbi:tyrosine-type recombinase/integrase [Saccharopolyspora spinosa]|uniref:Phage integrase family protein n=1 Tax=Saccharopolyspora spinosa TaxID=60894 RepID=A0A2N3Y7Z0_SACSN|nr:tyrosine-type recombinase/integrase [Saccharopolyspora spinosa]PKW18983.1 phage integrase family protein [Saccharopolyspora spinosa]
MKGQAPTLGRHPGPGLAGESKNYHPKIWQSAFTTAGLDYRTCIDGMHALRHTFASTILAGGVTIRELAEYLGRKDPRFTLRVYTHMLPSSRNRARAAIDDVTALLTASDQLAA